MKVGCCSSLFALSPLVVLLGLCVLGVSLGTLGVTTSFFLVFPFGAPLWCGTMVTTFYFFSAMFVILGIFMLTTYHPSELHLQASSNKPQIWFTLIGSTLATLDCLLAVGLSAWYKITVTPSFSRCFPAFTPSYLHPLTTCECAHGFTDPPSLHATISDFKDVVSCDSLGKEIIVFYWVLIGLYCVGGVLSFSVGWLVGKKLYTLGGYGKSGMYTVTLEPKTPTFPDSVSVSHMPTITTHGYAVDGSGHLAESEFSVIQRCAGNSRHQSTSSSSFTQSHSRTQMRRVCSPSNSSHTVV